MRPFGLLATTAVLMTFALPLNAQERWAVEFSGGAAVPTGDLGDLDLNAGLAFGGTVSVKVMPHLGIYGGWDWVHFSADETGPGGEVDVEETGYVLGLRFEHPFRGEEGLPKFRLQAGGTYKHIELEDEEGELIADSGHGLGWELGAGLVLPLGERWTATPGFRFRSLSRDLDFGAGGQSVDLRYVTFDVGFAWRF
jgi:hypothetical protein